MRRRLPALLVLAAASLAGCHTGPEVARVADGRDASGRWIEPEAYAAYLEGALAEERGDLLAARRAYEATIARDSLAGEAWARLGAVTCLTARAESDSAFARARTLSPDLEDGWLASAECALLRGDAAAAVSPAERALALGPTDPAASRALGTALARAGEGERSRRLLHALALRIHQTTGVDAHAVTGEASVERALAAGDAAAARAAGRRASLSDSEIALRALSMGRPDLARQVLDRALLSDPGDASARALALASADLERQGDALARLSKPLPLDRTRATPAALAEMGALLSRRVGRDAAEAWAAASVAASR